jgi:hypothetical protein
MQNRKARVWEMCVLHFFSTHTGYILVSVGAHRSSLEAVGYYLLSIQQSVRTLPTLNLTTSDLYIHATSWSVQTMGNRPFYKIGGSRFVFVFKTVFPLLFPSTIAYRVQYHPPFPILNSIIPLFKLEVLSKTAINNHGEELYFLL